MLNKLSDELLLHVFIYLSTNAHMLLIIALVNKNLNRLSQDNTLWKVSFYKRFHYLPNNKIHFFKRSYENQLRRNEVVQQHSLRNFTWLKYQSEFHLLNALKANDIEEAIALIEAGVTIEIYKNKKNKFFKLIDSMIQLKLQPGIFEKVLSCLFYYNNGIRDSAICACIATGSVDYLKKILNYLGPFAVLAILKKNPGGWNALHYSVCEKDARKLYLILDLLGQHSGNGLLMQGIKGKTPIHLAIFKANNTAMNKIIESLGDKAPFALMMKDSDGNTPLYDIAARRNLMVFEKIIMVAKSYNDSDLLNHLSSKRVLKALKKNNNVKNDRIIYLYEKYHIPYFSNNAFCHVM
jgi:F-box-like